MVPTLIAQSSASTSLISCSPRCITSQQLVSAIGAQARCLSLQGIDSRRARGARSRVAVAAVRCGAPSTGSVQQQRTREAMCGSGGSPWRHAMSLAVAGGLSLQLLLAPASLAVLAPSQPDIDTFENVPTQLSAQGEVKDVPLSSVVSGPKKKEIEGCTRKCVPTCARGGDGAPGLGPISVRKEIVVFKEGFRSRQYCLSECARVCAVVRPGQGHTAGAAD
eukprot:XP_001700361.1 predicted protein [Chlamydomonas reinhardtii]